MEDSNQYTDKQFKENKKIKKIQDEYNERETLIEQLKEQYNNTPYQDVDLYREYIQDSLYMSQNFQLLKNRQS